LLVDAGCGVFLHAAWGNAPSAESVLAGDAVHRARPKKKASLAVDRSDDRRATLSALAATPPQKNSKEKIEGTLTKD
jgi:hypothetical protein